MRSISKNINLKFITLKFFAFCTVFSLAIALSGCSQTSTSDINAIKVSWSDEKPSIEIPEGFTTDSLQVKVLEQGTGDTVKEDDTLSCDYLLELTDGTKIDSSYDRGEPSEFSLQSVIGGWKYGLAGKTVGSKVLLAVPPNDDKEHSGIQLGYGSDANGNIPANSVLIFVVEIHKIVKAE